MITFFNQDLCILAYYGRGIVGNIVQTSAKNKAFSHQLGTSLGKRAHPIVGRVWSHYSTALFQHNTVCLVWIGIISRLRFACFSRSTIPCKMVAGMSTVARSPPVPCITHSVCVCAWFFFFFLCALWRSNLNFYSAAGHVYGSKFSCMRINLINWSELCSCEDALRK